MTNAKLSKFRFKPDAKHVWMDWTEELKRRRDEVIETLKNEGVVSESCFISNDGEYVYYFMEAEDFEKARNASLTSSFPIDVDHKVAFRGSLELVEHMDCLFHFENRD